MDLSTNAQKVFDLVKELSAIELVSLVKKMEEEFGVSAAAVAVAWVAPAGDDAGSAAAVDSVTVELTDAGQQKIAVIKVVKELLDLGLKEAKEKVEAAPCIIKEKIKQEEADAIKAKLEEAGATVSFK